jgi:hypothetical protein
MTQHYLEAYERESKRADKYERIIKGILDMEHEYVPTPDGGYTKVVCLTEIQNYIKEQLVLKND